MMTTNPEEHTGATASHLKKIHRGERPRLFQLSRVRFSNDGLQIAERVARSKLASRVPRRGSCLPFIADSSLIGQYSPEPPCPKHPTQANQKCPSRPVQESRLFSFEVASRQGLNKHSRGKPDKSHAFLLVYQDFGIPN